MRHSVKPRFAAKPSPARSRTDVASHVISRRVDLPAAGVMLAADLWEPATHPRGTVVLRVYKLNGVTPETKGEHCD
ncbi:hypothetical protein MHEC_27160 [Mycobacterium heckeshornense]|uniref:Uncharacterized protein n=1 Tax=Mycobacterium heckeshornense TaxID=110505 RepID=A0A7R7GUH6_9MYCO|nr:hypothetical protein MHEC_27160 [Mycobacterium heckeshornense]